jgi:hypothetical protein
VFVHSRKSSFISPVWYCWVCFCRESREKYDPCVCGENKSVGEGEKKKMVGKISFWGRVHTCWRKRWRTSHTFLLCFAQRDTVLTVWVLLVDSTHKTLFCQVFLLSQGFLFFLSVSSVSKNPYLFSVRVFVGSEGLVTQPERRKDLHTHTQGYIA